MIILFHWHQGAAPKGNGLIVPIILLLGQHGTQLFIGGISLQHEWLVEIQEHQHGGRLNLVLQEPHHFLHLWRQLYQAYLDFLSQHIIQRSWDVSESLDEASVVSCQPTKCMDMGEGFWHWELLYCVHIFSAGMDPLMGYMVHQVNNRRLKE